MGHQSVTFGPQQSDAVKRKVLACSRTMFSFRQQKKTIINGILTHKQTACVRVAPLIREDGRCASGIGDSKTTGMDGFVFQWMPVGVFFLFSPPFLTHYIIPAQQRLSDSIFFPKQKKRVRIVILRKSAVEVDQLKSHLRMGNIKILCR